MSAPGEPPMPGTPPTMPGVEMGAPTGIGPPGALPMTETTPTTPGVEMGAPMGTGSPGALPVPETPPTTPGAPGLPSAAAGPAPKAEQPKWPDALEIKEEGGALVKGSFENESNKVLVEAEKIYSQIQNVVEQVRKFRKEKYDKYHQMVDEPLDKLLQKTNFQYGIIKGERKIDSKVVPKENGSK